MTSSDGGSGLVDVSSAPSSLEQTLGRLVEAGIAQPDDLAASLGLESRQIGRPLRKLALAGFVEGQPSGNLRLTPAGRSWLQVEQAPGQSNPPPPITQPPPLIAQPASPIDEPPVLPEPLVFGNRLAAPSVRPAQAQPGEEEPTPVSAERQRLSPWERPRAARVRDAFGQTPGDAEPVSPTAPPARRKTPSLGFGPRRALMRSIRGAWASVCLAVSRVHVSPRRIRLALSRVRLGPKLKWPRSVRLGLPVVGKAVRNSGLAALDGRRVAAVAALAAALLFVVQLSLSTGASVVGAHTAHDDVPVVPVPTVPAVAPVALVAPEPTPAPAPVEHWAVVQHTDGVGLVLRPAPASPTRVLTLQEGARLRVTGDPVQQSGRAWLPVASQTGKTGWVANDFVAPAP